MEPSGNARKGLLIVGEAPGRHEDNQGTQFVGETGTLLRRVLSKLGVSLDKDCLKTNALICRPPDNKIPDPKMIGYCRPNLLNTVREHDPEVIVLLGGVAVASLIGHLFKADTGGIKRWAGSVIKCRRPNAWICPTFHPSFVQRMGEGGKDKGMMERVFTKHLAAAVKLVGTRPWGEGVPDYASKVRCVFDPDKAAKAIREMIKRGGNVAFDYETNMLKPDSKKARIVSCSVCWNGKYTIAYPWMGDAITATRELIKSPLGKIASNAKFEERWTRRKLKTRVRNWRWDTMIIAHALDCRGGITSIKHQAFVRLGQEDYDGHLKRMLHSKEDTGNAENQVKDIALKDLLLYGGLDSLLEYMVAEEQARELGVTL